MVNPYIGRARARMASLDYDRLWPIPEHAVPEAMTEVEMGAIVFVEDEIVASIVRKLEAVEPKPWGRTTRNRFEARPSL